MSLIYSGVFFETTILGCSMFECSLPQDAKTFKRKDSDELY